MTKHGAFTPVCRVMEGVAKETTLLGGPLNVSSDFQIGTVILCDRAVAPATTLDSEIVADAENILCVGCTTSLSSQSSTFPPVLCSVATRMASQSSRFTKLIPVIAKHASSDDDVDPAGASCELGIKSTRELRSYRLACAKCSVI